MADSADNPFIDEATIARLRDDRQRLIADLHKNAAFLAAFGADMATINDPIPHRVRRRGRGRPRYEDATLADIYTAIRVWLFEERTLPTKPQILQRVGISEDTMDRRLREVYTTWERVRDELASVILPPSR